MKHLRILFFLVAALGLGSCAKTETTTQNDSLVQTAPPPPAAPAEKTDMSANEPNGMGAMMLQKLGAADQNYDQRFIELMIPHHEGAIMMSKDAIAKTSKPELKSLAESIIADQKKEIADMTAWEKKWYNKAPEVSSEMQMMTQKMAQGLGPAGAEYEDSFIDAMIPHHEGAIAMAKDALGKSTHPEIKQLAQKIIKGQQAEIDKMKSFRKQWYGH